MDIIRKEKDNKELESTRGNSYRSPEVKEPVKDINACGMK